jgi:nucleoside-diphosphate-sugar epimerase
MRVLVTGDSGFIGKNLVDYLLSHTTHEIYGISRTKDICLDNKVGRYTHAALDVSDLSMVEKFFNNLGPFDYVFHLAAEPLVKKTTQDVLYSNVVATDNILRQLGPETRFIFSSSATVYGESLKHRKCGNLLTEELPISFYGCTKLMAEKLVEFYSKNNGFSYIICRLVANCGEYSTHGVIHDLFYKSLEDSDVLEVLGNDPGTIKPYAYVKDTVSLLHFISMKEYYGIVDLSPKTSISVREVAETILDELGKTKKIVFTGGGWKGDDKKVSVVSNFRMTDSVESIRLAVNEKLSELQRRAKYK